MTDYYVKSGDPASTVVDPPQVGRRVKFTDPDGATYTGVVVSVQASEPCAPNCPCPDPGGKGQVTRVETPMAYHMFGDACGSTWEYVE